MSLPTLDAHLDGAGDAPAPPPELAPLVRALAGAAVRLTPTIRRAALTGSLGLAGGHNRTGDAQKKLDVIGNEIVLAALAGPGTVAAVVSEELGEPQLLAGPDGLHVVATDPFDGSSNTDVNGPVGTIFGVYARRPGPIDPAADLLRAGAEQVLAGYVLYGPATVLVYTAGRGTHGLTLDPEREAFVLTHPGLRCPPTGPYVSGNLVRAADWDAPAREFVALVGQPGGGRSWSLRYTGALVADVHRCLIDGGVYLYPADPKNKEGKLRLLYECAPLALVVEQAGGAATTGTQRILDVRPRAIHQRSPLVIGSRDDVALYGASRQDRPRAAAAAGS
jgi:fructose-1,6-bisphosphatase I